MATDVRKRRGVGGRGRRWLLLAALLAVAASLPIARGDRQTNGMAAATPEPWAAAAEAFRRDELEHARRLLEDGGGDRGEANLVLGLWAYESGQPERAVPLLRAAAAPAGRFEDWRLLVLADCYATLDQLPAAAAALARLLETQPDSPLRSRALLQAGVVARDRGDRAAAESWIERRRRLALTPTERAQLEETAWEIAVAGGDHARQHQLARRLLVEQPIIASKLQVVEIYRQPSGALDWLQFLTPEQLLERASNLLAVGVTAGALDALDAVPQRRRELDWSLLRADVLITAQRGIEAAALLAQLETTSRSDAIRLERLRAAAALEAARVRRRRPVPPAVERERLRRSARQHLWRVLELAADEPAHRQAAIEAHRLLLQELLDEEMLEPALGLLRTLRHLDPDDTAGAAFLWRRGWREYQQRNYTGAVGYWSELRSIYAGADTARAAHYWSARAYEALGESRRASQLYREVAAVGAEDFYRHHALARLADPQRPPLAEPPAPREPWPWDPTLERGRWLSDRGLDELALAEVRGLAERAEARAAAGLEAIVHARLGKPRDSIAALRRSFPQLGGLRQASAPAEALELYYPTAFEPIVRRFATAHRIPTPLLFAMIRQESAFDHEAVSRAGARGLMQLMPATGRELAGRLRLPFSTEMLSDPELNIRLGTSYFSQLLEMFDGNQQLALAGYNAGPYRIRRLWRAAGAAAETDRFLEGLELEETKRYVKRILLFSDSYERLYSGRV